MSWLSFILILFGASWACVGLFRAYAIRKGMLDQPNERSSHYAATARGGGVVFFVGWVILVSVLYAIKFIPYQMLECFYPIILVGGLGYLDDRGGLSTRIRFLFQCVAAISFLLIIHEDGSVIQNYITLSYPYSIVLIAFAMVWVTNLYNFMDGSDGMAAQQGLFFFTAMGYFLLQQQAVELGVLAWGLAALLAGFLTWNWPVARIFMGDSGAYFLGFTIAVYAILSHKYFGVSFVVSAILMSLFWFDATITLLRRVAKREKWYQPHRLHAYQRLIQRGWSHQTVLMGAIAVNIVLAGLAYMAFHDPHHEKFAFFIATGLLTCLYLGVEIIKPMYRAWYGATK